MLEQTNVQNNSASSHLLGQDRYIHVHTVANTVTLYYISSIVLEYII